MPVLRLGWKRAGAIVALSALALGPGLGGSGRLTYHEAIWAQVAREMSASGNLLVPTLDGRPWLEKPPLPTWLTVGVGRLAGGITEASARFPAAVSATLLALGVAMLAARRFGRTTGLLAGCVQATSAWTVMRGRLAEADIVLAALVVWAVLAFDHLRPGDGNASTPPRSRWRWGFFALLGLTALVKGIGFGAVLVLAVVGLVIAWDRDREALRALRFVPGWVLAGVLALAWPALVVVQYPRALGLWLMHVADRLSSTPEHFIGEPWWQYGPALFWQTLPWTPLALAGAWRSLRRATVVRGGGDRLLWAWAVGPAVLVSLASARNAHYLIYALPPWSAWAAFGLQRWGLRWRRAGSPGWFGRRALAGFVLVGLAYAVGFSVCGPWFDRRGAEWAFYQQAGRTLKPGEPLALLYDGQRKPYETPFGPVPHDLAVRLFYLDRGAGRPGPACWRVGLDDLTERPPAPWPAPFAVIAPAADLPALGRLGRVEPVLSGPTRRPDRSFALYRITPRAELAGKKDLTQRSRN